MGLSHGEKEKMVEAVEARVGLALKSWAWSVMGEAWGEIEKEELLEEFVEFLRERSSFPKEGK